jgi:hypothetical protein
MVFFLRQKLKALDVYLQQLPSQNVSFLIFLSAAVLIGLLWSISLSPVVALVLSVVVGLVAYLVDALRHPKDTEDYRDHSWNTYMFSALAIVLWLALVGWAGLLVCILFTELAFLWDKQSTVSN